MLRAVHRLLSQAPPLKSTAALSSSAAVLGGSKQKPVGHPDEYIFKDHCKGTRVASKEALETSESLRRADFGSLKRRRTAAPVTSGAASVGGRSATVGTSQPRTQAAPPGGTSGQGFASASERDADDAAQELTEKGSKRLMQTGEGREELAMGSFDVDKTTERVLEEGKKDASPEAKRRGDDEDVQEAVKSRIVSGSQTT